MVANNGWTTSPVKAVSRRRRGRKARLYRALLPCILDHQGRCEAPLKPAATVLPATLRRSSTSSPESSILPYPRETAKNQFKLTRGRGNDGIDAVALRAKRRTFGLFNSWLRPSSTMDSCHARRTSDLFSHAAAV